MPHRHLTYAVLAAAALTPLLGGCAQERHTAVPATAMLGAEGEKRLTYTTNGPGTIYVYDDEADRLLYSGDVSGERQITVDPERNEISVDGALVQDKTLTRGRTHRIFFQPRYR